MLSTQELISKLECVLKITMRDEREAFESFCFDYRQDILRCLHHERSMTNSMISACSRIGSSPFTKKMPINCYEMAMEIVALRKKVSDLIKMVPNDVSVSLEDLFVNSMFEHEENLSTDDFKK